MWIVNFHVLEKCVHPVILGRRFLVSTKSLNEFSYRIQKKQVDCARNRLCFLGPTDTKTRGSLNGHRAWALADTGSDVMVVSPTFAERLGMNIQREADYRVWVGFADGSTRRTQGMVLDAEWSFKDGTKY